MIVHSWDRCYLDGERNSGPDLLLSWPLVEVMGLMDTRIGALLRP